MKQTRIFLTAVLLCLTVITASCQENDEKKTDPVPEKTTQSELKVTFIELGSVNCIPCKAMQPIMRDIERDFPGQVKVVFYDVWTEAGQPFSSLYKIRVIPTQVFLDKDGKEFFRHEGYFPKEELIKVLKFKGVQ